jgi:hypothetical protein
MKERLEIDQNWQILQDVYNLGVTREIYKPDFGFTDVHSLFSEWEPISCLTHLQLLMSENPGG